MQCIYLDEKGNCRAHPWDVGYKPDESVLKEYCKTEDFRGCPRLIAYHDYLEAKGEKPKKE